MSNTKEITPEQEIFDILFENINVQHHIQCNIGYRLSGMREAAEKIASKYGLSTPVTDDDKPFDTPILHKPISDFFEKPSTVTDEQLQKEAEAWVDKFLSDHEFLPRGLTFNWMVQTYIAARKHSVTPVLSEQEISDAIDFGNSQVWTKGTPVYEENKAEYIAALTAQQKQHTE